MLDLGYWATYDIFTYLFPFLEVIAFYRCKFRLFAMATFYDLNRSKNEFRSRGYDTNELNWEDDELYENRSCGYNTDGLNWEYNEFCENRGGSGDWIDPVDLLPVDPFGMELGTNLAAAIAGWIEDLNALENIVSIAGFYDCELYNCNMSHGKASSSCDSFDYTIADDLIGGEEDHKNYVPHEGLMLSLSYLGVEDLLSVDRVCKSLHFAVQNDWWLWRCVHIDSPLNGKIDDDALERLCSKAQGRLQCLSLNECSRITDDGLRNVLESNPMLGKLSISGCMRLSVEGLISSLKAFKTSSITGIQTLKLGKQFRISSEEYEALQLLVGGNGSKAAKPYTPRFYHIGESSTACDNEDRALDIELCSGCQKYKLIFDCPSENCQRKKEQCRACDKCIERCVKCGRCVKDCSFVETFFIEIICADCWKQTPSCHEE